MELYKAGSTEHNEEPEAVILSVLICSIPERKLILEDLLYNLKLQIQDFPGQIEVLVDGDFSSSIGEKRNRLVRASSGLYISFIDDDDEVSGEYCKKVMAATKSLPDSIAMRGYMFEGDELKGIFEHSLKYKTWVNDMPGMVKWGRPANHLNPIKKSLLPIDPFTQKSHGEDRDYSDLITPLLKTEVLVELPIYKYIHRNK